MGPYGNTPTNSQYFPCAFFTFQEVRCLVSPINLESVVKFVIKTVHVQMAAHTQREGGRDDLLLGAAFFVFFNGIVAPLRIFLFMFSPENKNYYLL